MKKVFFLLFLFSLSFGKAPDWMKAQIKEDLRALEKQPLSSEKLRVHFRSLCDQNIQAIYLCIRNNVIKKEYSPRADSHRNKKISAYLKYLSKKYSLPDTDFILISEDGLDKSFSFPVFAFAKHKNATNVILFPDFEMLWELLDKQENKVIESKVFSKKIPWEEKISQAFFRGASTGIFNPNDPPAFGNDRMKVIIFSCEYPDLVNASFHATYYGQFKNYLALANKPTEHVSVKDHYKYKYLMDIDGNSCTYSRCRWILLSNSVLVKMESPNIQWYYKALIPWENYVPFKADLSDLKDTLEFLIRQDEIAHTIARKGQRLGKSLFRENKVDLYIVKLLKNYAKYIKAI